jgi:phosphatidylserine decarboxylase
MIKYFNRKTKTYEVEKVAGGKYLEWTYSSPIGMKSLDLIVKKKAFSLAYGKYCDSRFSRRKIHSFMRDFKINEAEFKHEKSQFRNFNDFFARSLTEKARPIESASNTLISPGDGRLFAYENIDINNLVQIKGITYSLKELIENTSLAEKYINGTCLILRLAPIDYHRFHFIDEGVCEKTKKIKGAYYSVNPIALNKIPKLFCENKREYSLFHSHNFGDVLYVDIGATCVGSIIQTYTPNVKVNRGDEKGYFKFGGSTIVLFFENNKISIDKDIIEETNKGYECKINMGEKIGVKL